MISKPRHYLLSSLLVVAASNSSGIQLDPDSGNHSSAAMLPCPAWPQHSASTVTYVHGNVINQYGQQIEAGAQLAPTEIISVRSDGFLSALVPGGETVNLQPDSTTSIACAANDNHNDLHVSQPYRVGAIRG